MKQLLLFLISVVYGVARDRRRGHILKDWTLYVITVCGAYLTIL